MAMHLQHLKCNRDARLSQVSLTAEMWKGHATRFNLGLFDGATMATVSEITSLTFMVKLTRDSTEAEVMTATLAGDALDQITGDQWLAKTHASAVFDFTNDECNLEVAGDKQTYWLTIEALLENGSRVIYGAGLLTVYNANATSAGAPPANDPTYPTLAEADARYMRGAFRLTLSENEDYVHFFSTGGSYRGSLQLLDLSIEDLDP